MRWIQDNLIHAEGDFFGKRFRLRPDQRLFVWNWCTFCESCGVWRYDRALKGAASGDGKTEFVAALACLEFAGPSQIAPASPNIVIAAASFDQANKLFGKVATMLGGRDQVVHEAPLCGFFTVLDTKVKFADGRPGVIERVAANAGTNEGGEPTLFIGDELHEWGEQGSPRARVHVVIGKSAAKRRTPHGPGRVIDLSTAGSDVDHSLLGTIYKHAKRVEHNPALDVKFLVDWREADPRLDLSKPDQRAVAVRQASAAADLQWSVAHRVRQWDAVDMPHHEWIRYYGNRFLDISDDSWLSDDPGAWDECRHPKILIPRSVSVKVAVDMALKRDSVAVLVLHRRADDRVVVRSRIWNPDDRKIDHLDVLAHIRDLGGEFDVEEITYDPRFFEVPARILEDEGFNMVEFPQSIERMTPAVGLTLEKIRARAICHDGDPDLASHVKGAAKRPNDRGITLSKGKSRRHIDAAVALCIGVYRLFATQPPKASIYEDGEVLVL